MKSTDKNALEIAKRGGAVASGDWVKGTGNYVTKRAIPQLCREIEIIPALNHGTMDKRSLAAVEKLHAERPRVRRCIIIANWPAVDSIIESATVTA